MCTLPYDVIIFQKPKRTQGQHGDDNNTRHAQPPSPSEKRRLLPFLCFFPFSGKQAAHPAAFENRRLKMMEKGNLDRVKQHGHRYQKGRTMAQKLSAQQGNGTAADIVERNKINHEMIRQILHQELNDVAHNTVCHKFSCPRAQGGMKHIFILKCQRYPQQNGA